MLRVDLPAIGKNILLRPTCLIGGSVLVVVVVGLLSGWSWLAPEIRYAFDGDWRHTTAGLQRVPGRSSLSGQSVSLVHFHDLDGREGDFSIRLSATRAAGAARLCVFRNGVLMAAPYLSRVPAWIRVPIAPGERSLDVGLVAFPGQPAARPLMIDEIAVHRVETLGSLVRRVLPIVVGLVVLLVGRSRLGLLSALAWAVIATLGSSAALCVVYDPTALARFRPGLRARFQWSLASMIGFMALMNRKPRRLALAAVTGALLTVHLPSIRNGLTNDDFLWARPWTLSEVLSTFHGSEDPLGISNEYFRPLASVSHALDHMIWGLNPEAYHFTNIVLAFIAVAVLYELLLRVGLPSQVGLLGALLVAAHPLVASAIGWISQRTDVILTINYLLALTVLLVPRGNRMAPALTWTALALCSKETAVTLPIVATALCWSVLPTMEWRARWRILRALFYALALYLAYWTFLFPDKLAAYLSKTAPIGATTGLGAIAPWRWLSSFYAPFSLPLHYEEWSRMPLSEKDAFHLVGGTLLGMTLLLWTLGRRSVPRVRKRLAVTAFFWPLIVILPMTALGGIDIYRLGFLPVVAFAVFVSVVAAPLARHRTILALLGAALIAWMSFYAARTSAEWGPGGFYYEQELLFFRLEPERTANWPEKSRQIYLEQQRYHDHMESPLDDLASLARAPRCAPAEPE